MSVQGAPAAEAAVGPVYASWGRRVVAWLVDLVVVGTPIVAAIIPLGEAYGGETTADALAFWFFATPPIVLFVVGYHGLLQGGRRGQTLGKRAVGIAVRRAEDLGPIGYGRSIARAARILLIWLFFGLISLLVIPILDGLWALWDRNNQTVHDKLALTVVVRVRREPGRRAPTAAAAPFPYANWGRRFFAWLIDLPLVLVPIALGGAVVAVATGTETAGELVAFWLVFVTFATLVVVLYSGLQQGGERGQTLGKRALGIAVRRAEDFAPLGYGRSFGRASVMALLWLFGGTVSLLVIPILDGAWALWDESNRTLHDKLAGTVVFRVRGEAAREQPVESGLPDAWAGEVEALEAPPPAELEPVPEQPTPAAMGTGLERDRYTITRSRYRYEISADGTPVAFANPRGKILGVLGEEIPFFADEGEEEGLFSLEWGAIADLVHWRGELKAPDGSGIGTLERVMARSVVRSTWRVLVHSAEMARAEEKSLGAALLRPWMRPLVPYQLRIVSGGRPIGEFRRTARARNVYELDLTPDADRQLDRRLAVALGVALAEIDHSVFD